MTDQPSTTPARPERAGWFDDPDDSQQLRYFDGILWTSHTTPRRTIWSVTEPAAATTAPSATEPVGPYGYPLSPTPATQSPPARPPQVDPYGPAASRSGYPTGPTTSDGAPLASIAARFAAWLLDSVITWTVGLVLGGPLFWLGLGNYPEVVADALRTGATDAVAMAERIRFDLAWMGAFAVVQLIIGVGYHTLFLSRRGATPGKQVAGISVRRADRPGLLTGSDALRRSVLRPVLWLFSWAPVLSLFAVPLSVFDAASALWDPQRQTLHDKIARTVVVQGPQERGPGRPS